MRKPIPNPPVFDPAARTLDFSSTPGFDVRHVYGVAHPKSGQLIYSPIVPELALVSVTGSVMTLAFDTSQMLAGDPLDVQYDDGVNDLPPNAATADRQDTGNMALAAIRALLAGSIVTADTLGSLAAGASATPVAPNLTRQFIEITNTGPNPLAYRWGAAATATIGHILSPGQSVRYDSKVPTAALSLFSTNGTTFFVTTG